MAYVDQNGLVLIDEVEATEDIKKLKDARNLLIEATELINQIVAINSGFKGNTAEAIEFVNVKLLGCINSQINGIEAGEQMINKVVNYYSTVDTNMKDQINANLD